MIRAYEICPNLVAMMGPQKAIWCPAGLDLFVDLKVELVSSNARHAPNSCVIDDDRSCQETTSKPESSSTVLLTPSANSPSLAQEPLAHRCESRDSGEALGAELLESSVDGRFSPSRSHGSCLLPQHDTPDLSIEKQDVHMPVEADCCKDGETLRCLGNTSSGKSLASELPEAAGVELRDSSMLDHDEVQVQTSDRLCDIQHDKYSDIRANDPANDCNSQPQLDRRVAAESHGEFASSESVIGNGFLATCEEPYAFAEGGCSPRENLPTPDILDSSSRETSDMDADDGGVSHAFRLHTESSECEQEWDPAAGATGERCGATSSDENMDSDCSGSPKSVSEVDAKCPGIEQFNLAEISAACQLVGISNRLDRPVPSPDIQCCKSGLRGVSDLEWMSRTLLELLSPIRDLDMDAYTLLHGTKRRREAEEYWCSSESGTMTESTTRNLPAETASINRRHQKSDSSPGSFDGDWEDSTVDDEILDRPPWKREYRSLREILR